MTEKTDWLTGAAKAKAAMSLGEERAAVSHHTVQQGRNFIDFRPGTLPVKRIGRINQQRTFLKPRIHFGLNAFCFF